MSDKTALLLLSILILASGCGFIDLTPLDIKSCPSKAGDILKVDEELSLTFSLPVRRHRTEALLRIEGPSGPLEGDVRWDNNTLTFHPLSEPQKGYRYLLVFQGEVITTDGRYYQKDLLLPFYYVMNSEPPLLTEIDPEGVSPVDVNQSLVLMFSRSMDVLSVEDAFSIQPGTEVLFSWDQEDTEVTVTPKTQWTNLWYYTWTLGPEARDRAEVPVPTEYSGSFLVQLDTAAPVLVSAHPAGDNGDGSFTLLDFLSLDDLTGGEHIALLFSEEIRFSTLRRSFSLTPSLEGYLLSLSPDSALYYITESLPPEQEYTLTVQKGLEDTAGNPTAEDMEQRFTSAVPAVEIPEILIDHSGGVRTVPPEEMNLPEPLLIEGFEYYGTSPDLALNIRVKLSRPYGTDERLARAAFVESLSLSPLFPPEASAPSLFSSSWVSSTMVHLQFRDLLSCTENHPVYYRFTVSGGDSGTANAEGSYLLKTVSCTFRGALE